MNRDAWRAQVIEPAIDPDLPVIDPHHHLWPVTPSPHLEPYTDDELIADVRGCGHNIVATVAVEAWGSYRTDGPAALRPVGETDHAEALARREHGLCAGIVAHADLLLGDAVAEVLEAHRQAAPARLRGIRHVTASDPDLPFQFGIPAGLMADAVFRAGFARLAGFGLSFDAYVAHPQLPEIMDLAQAFPGTLIILDHLGGPLGVGRFAGDGQAAFRDWRAALAPLAACPNIVVKLGGMHLDITGFGRLSEAAPLGAAEMAALHRDYVLAAIDLFGPARVMFESNFPVDRMSTPYGVLWNCFKIIAAGFTPAERSDLFAGTARRVYRITPDHERRSA
jgi:predicted TIM-barrel fold metal-dependent hydrolase